MSSIGATPRRGITTAFTPLAPYLAGRWRAYAAGLFWLLLTNGFALAIPWLMKQGIDTLSHPDPTLWSTRSYAAAIIVAALCHGGARVLSRTTLLHAARGIEFEIRETLFETLLHLDPPFFTRERTGDLISRFTNDLTNIRMLVGFGALNILNTAILTVSALTLMIRISPLLTVAVLFPFPLMILVVKRLSGTMFLRSREVQEELGEMTSFVEENVTAAAVIRSWCREEDQTHRFGEASGRYRDASLKMARIRAMMVPVMATTGGAGTLLLLLVGGTLVIHRSITLGDFVAFGGYLAMLVWPTVVMGWILNLLQRGAASMERISLILETPPDIPKPAPAAGEPDLTDGITVRNLTFTRGERTILQGISFSVPKGKSLGITGPVGCGKSTLVGLLSRLLPLQEGEICYGSTPIGEIPEETLRRLVTVVPQESILFSRTIRENILYGVDGGDDRLLREVAERASLTADLSTFGEGYDTLVGERGVTLSGGQRQRIAIARALATRAPVLILDDPLSAVDARTEEAILSRLVDPTGERITIVVSHRISPLAWCDRIILLDGGRIVEEGNHATLVAQGGAYARLWELQKIERELEEI